MSRDPPRWGIASDIGPCMPVLLALCLCLAAFLPTLRAAKAH